MVSKFISDNLTKILIFHNFLTEEYIYLKVYEKFLKCVGRHQVVVLVK